MKQITADRGDLFRRNAWRKIQQGLKAEEFLSSPERAAQLEQFREKLVAACGEEPSIVMTLKGRACDEHDFLDVPLSEYLGWLLKARHAAFYWAEGADDFQCVASLGSGAQRIPRKSPLPRWMAIHGPLVRSKLTLAGLSADEAEALLDQLESLEASLVVPVNVNEKVWGFFVVGPSLSGVGEEMLGASVYLSLYGLEIVGSIERRRRGFPRKSDARAQQENKALRDAQEFWLALRPQEKKVKLLIFDEEMEIINSLKPFFESWGLEVRGAATREEFSLLLKEFQPQILMMDLSHSGSSRGKLFEVARALLPHVLFLGTTTGFYSTREECGAAPSLPHLLPRPCRFTSLARQVFEAASSLPLQGEPAHA